MFDFEPTENINYRQKWNMQDLQRQELNLVRQMKMDGNQHTVTPTDITNTRYESDK